MGELFGALGLAWPRLLIYPGGLFALTLAWLVGLAGSAAHAPDSEMPLQVSALVMPLVAISMLPLPYAVEFAYGPDLIVTLALLDWPLLLMLARNPQTPLMQKGALLEHYMLILLSVAVLSAESGNLGLGELAAGPAEDLWAQLRRIIASLGWGLALLVGEVRRVENWALRLRLVGHLLIAGLPWLWLFGERPWLGATVPALLLAGSIFLRRMPVLHQVRRPLLHVAIAVLLLTLIINIVTR